MDFNSSSSDPLSASSVSPSAFVRAGKFLYWAFLCLSIFVLFLPLNPGLPTTDLDPSWAMAMNQAVAQQLRIGEDIVFTFGPYAAIYTFSYHPVTDLPALLGSAWLALGYCALLLLLVHGVPIWRGLCAILILCIFGTTSSFDSIFGSRDALLFSYPLLVCLVLAKIEGSERDVFFFFVALSGLGLLPLIKSSLFPPVVLALIFCALFLGYVQQRRIGGAPGTAVALIVAAAILLVPSATLFLCWHLSGQEAETLAAFVRNTLPIVSGYTDAMSVPGRRREIALYLLVTLAFVCFVILVRREKTPFAPQKKMTFATTRESGARGSMRIVGALDRNSEKLLVLAALLVFFFLAFKAGFVRHDFHALTAMAALLISAAFIFILFPGRISPMLLLLALTVALIVRNDYVRDYSPEKSYPTFVESLQQTSDAILKPFRSAAIGLWIRFFEDGGLKAKYAARLREIHTAQPLPTLPGTSDIYSFDQVTLLASNNSWAPRPIFQSYSVYTPELARMNEQHLLKATAPDNIFFRLQPIDGRLPALEDGSSWPLIFTRYTPVSFSGERIIFRKNAATTGNMPSLSPLMKKTAVLGETVSMPVPPPIQTSSSLVPEAHSVERTSSPSSFPSASMPPILFAHVKIEPSLTGKMVRFLFKNNPLHIELVLNDGSRRNFRFIPGMAEPGFILSPLLETPRDPLLLLTQHSSALDAKGVRTITLLSDGNEFLWRKEYEIQLQTLDLPQHRLEEIEDSRSIAPNNKNEF